jgi:hypothetical protein
MDEGHVRQLRDQPPDPLQLKEQHPRASPLARLANRPDAGLLRGLGLPGVALSSRSGALAAREPRP